MANIKNISTTLSVATTMLLVACSSESSDSSGPAPETNTKAPQLVGTWQTGCVVTTPGTTITTTQASGGSGGSVTGGEAYQNRVIFNENGRVEFSTEIYATSNCNTNTRTSSSKYKAVYFIGDATLANDSSAATEIDFSDSSSTTYSIFQIVSSTSLYLGDGATSSSGNDGSSDAVRLDGLGPEMLKQ